MTHRAPSLSLCFLILLYFACQYIDGCFQHRATEDGERSGIG